ncbi:unnamed protein product [Rotaria sp. Silwood2]|nr:unnamed protein product [Rotaria sp. Silwood2]CAF4220387.1 unnamed protein product [Rotaria sp. Silwood2]
MHIVNRSIKYSEQIEYEKRIIELALLRRRPLLPHRLHPPHRLHRLHRPHRLRRLHRLHRLQRLHRPHRLHPPHQPHQQQRLRPPLQQQRLQPFSIHVSFLVSCKLPNQIFGIIGDSYKGSEASLSLSLMQKS